jgi:alkylation response protein AidB-like acyl-CoA dehydrogenase
MAGMVSASLDAGTRDHVFADPTACYSYSAMPAGVARRVDGGYEVNGRWPFVTGVLDSRWAVLSAMIQPGVESPKPSHLRLGQPQNAAAIRTFVVPCDALVVEDTWSRAAAMRSSGSHAARAEAVFVPDNLVYSFVQPRVLDRSFYRMSPGVVFAAAASAIAVGVLRGALDATIETAGKKRSSLDGMAWAEHVSVRTGVARASAVHHCIRTGLLTALDDLQQRYETTATVAPEERAIAWATIFHVADEARTAVSSLAGPASSQAFISGHGLEMAIRDIHAIVVSLEVMRNIEEAAGAVLLGGEPGNVLF